MLRKSLELLLGSMKLPGLGPVGTRVLDAARYGRCTPKELGELIAGDDALGERLVALANVTREKSAPEVHTPDQAVAALGIPITRIATLAFCVLASHRRGGCQGFDYDRFWSRSLARASAAQVLSRVTRVGTPSESFALGLLGDVGQLALLALHEDKYAALLARHDLPAARDLTEAERRQFDVDHAELAAGLLEHWEVPTALANAIRRYESLGPASSGGRIRCIDELLLVAHSISEFCIGGEELSMSASRTQTLDLEGLARRAGLSHERFHAACSQIVVSWRDWAELLAIPADSPSAAPPARVAPPTASRPRTGPPRAGRSIPLQRSGTEPKAAAETGLRILAVDDDATSLAVLQRQLFLAGHAVTTANAGDEALSQAREKPPQLVVADWQMPGLDGIELCRELRRHAFGRKIYYLLLTGHGEVENVVNAFDAGVDDYVEKPFDPRILLARIKAGRRIIDLQEQVDRDQATQKAQLAELQLLTRKLRFAAMTDVLTGLPNRRFAMKRLAHEWELAAASGKQLTIVMVDIDEFKKVNDQHGHDVGDAVLRETARLLRSILREREYVCRLGGEEFLVICANSPVQETTCLAERLRAAVEANLVRWGEFEGAVTLSLGVARREAWMPGPDHLLKAADEAVYEAKAGGRNQVRVAAEWRGVEVRGA